MALAETESALEPPEATIGSFVAGVITGGSRQLVEHELRLRADPRDDVAIHQARVATRRLRANLATFRPILDRTMTDPLRDELRWVGGVLGAVRDAQVLALRLGTITHEHDLESNGLEPLVDLVAGQRDAATTNLSSALAGDRYLDLVERLRAACDLPPIRASLDPDAEARDVVRRVVVRRWRKVRRSIDGLDVDPTDDDLHDARKDIKRVRYALQAAKPLGVKRRGLVGQLGRVPDDLGDLHDAEETRTWLAQHRSRLGSEAGFLAGQIDRVAAEEHRRLRNDWRSTWQPARGLRLGRGRVE